MPTQCSTPKLQFQALHRRRVEAAFNGGTISSDAGGLLLREVEARRQLIARFAACFEDHRCQDRIEHTVEELLAQHIYALALGYEDVNDHDRLSKVIVPRSGEPLRILPGLQCNLVLLAFEI